jgi:phospholipid/cholesterol/gamma-HCH transport system substrate-binding protein
VNAGNLQAEAFRNFTLHIVLETLPNQPRPYGPQDAPRYGDKRGPYCGTLPTPPYNQQNIAPTPGNADDGVDEPTGKGTSRAGGSGWFSSGAGYAGGQAEADVLKGLLGPVVGSTAADVPDLGVLLVGPMARGAEVSLR